MLLFAVLLTRRDFDDYSVWITTSAFVLGLGQAVGVERVLVGRRTLPDGLASVGVLGLSIAVVQAGAAAALGNLPLAICALASLAYVRWDFLRFTAEPSGAVSFLVRDLLTLVAQIGAVLAMYAAGVPTGWLPVGWWGVGLVLWTLFAAARGVRRTRLATGWAVLRGDRRESFPLLADAAMAGIPLVVALALARAQAGVGVASDARLALTILGPMTVIGLGLRRVLYRMSADGRLTRRGTVVFSLMVPTVFAMCAGLLLLTRTPPYAAVLHDFSALSWATVVGFALNHAVLMAVMLPAAYLRAEGRTAAVGVARTLATVAGVGVALALMPFDDPADVAWAVAAGSIAYLLAMWTALTLTKHQTTVRTAT